MAVYLHGQQFGANPLVRFLLDKGIDANLGNDRGNTVLHIATRKNFPSILKILLGFGVDIDRKNTNEESALYIAANLVYCDYFNCKISYIFHVCQLIVIYI